MAVIYTCDICGKPVDEEEILRKKITFVNRMTTNMAVA